MTQPDNKLIQAAKYAAEKLNIAGVSPRFISAWWISENGWTFPDTNNVGNISFSGSGTPSTGVFRGVTSVNSNKTVNYGTWEEGVDAFVELITVPKKDKALTLDSSDLSACGGSAEKLAETIGKSNWAESHYNNGGGDGSLIMSVYHSSGLDVFSSAQPVHVATIHSNPRRGTEPRGSYKIRPGDSLSQIALNTHTTVHALAVFNDISNADKINAGDTLQIPGVYRVSSGDTVTAIAHKYGTTVSKIAAMNRINPNVIYVGNHLFV